MKKEYTYAPLRWRVILPALLAVVLLAAGVCVLHGVNAVSLRGAAALDAYTQLSPAGEQLTLAHGPQLQARTYARFADGDKQFALHISDPRAERGVLHIEGILLRIDQPVGEIRMRVGLVAGDAQEAVLLSTQMVRRPEVSVHGHDDHCGFSAAVRQEDLQQGAYRVVLADETDGAKRMIDAGLTVEVRADAVGFARMDAPEGEVQHAQ